MDFVAGILKPQFVLDSQITALLARSENALGNRYLQARVHASSFSSSSSPLPSSK